ncbi:hypothetical protein EW145_g4032 [Phellinidium pouzarii]|uniref:Proteasome assembly chaperone 2 n=1 Tax=Phellinidium pouzarii TaxID=167371 RepID=A0A4S4L6D9_9AGAM|nr:hypothetical protein EW145_g4032 [Phellinidium pouzarii]
MVFYYPYDSTVSLKSKVLVVPVVSVGNVSQLAVDLLIATIGLKQIGIFDARDLVPVAGPREEGSGISTPLELYGKDGVDVVVIQQRSPVVKSHKESFSTSLLMFVQENELGALLFLTGVDLSNRSDAQMRSPIHSLIPPRSPSLESSPISLISQLPVYTYATLQTPSGASVLSVPTTPTLPYSPDSIPFIPGGGLTRRLLSHSPPSSNTQKWTVPTAAILQFVLEGDNRADAEYLAGVVAGVLHLRVDGWKQPGSWNVGLFGTPHDQTLYG